MSSSPSIPEGQSPPSPTTIYSLPDEILTSVINLVDLSSALSTARVSHRFNACSEPRIWRDVDLSLKKARPSTRRFEDAKARLLGLSVPKAERHAAEKAAHTADIEVKARAIARNADSPRGRLIQTLRMEPTGATAWMVGVLKAATNLKSLEISKPDRGGPQYQEELDPRSTLDYWLLRSKLHLPAFTQIQISESALQYWETLPCLCNAAPSLTHLSLKIDLDSSVKEDLDISPPTYLRKTKIKQLRLVFGDPETPLTTTARFLRLLRQCPELEQFSVLYDPNGTPDEAATNTLLIAALSTCKGLKDLFWDSETFHMREYLDRNTAGTTDFHAVRRFIYATVEWDTIFDHIPRLPNVESIYLNRDLGPRRDNNDTDVEWDDEDGESDSGGPLFGWPGPKFGPSFDRRDPSISSYPSTLPRSKGNRPASSSSAIRPSGSSRIQSMLPDFADRLRGAPKLRLILSRREGRTDDDFDYFTRLADSERKGKNVIGYINSIRCGGQELLFARLFLPYVQKDDIPSPPAPAVPAGSRYQRQDIKRIVYTAADGTSRTRMFSKLDKPIWLDYSDFEGKAVPMSVIEEMRKMEGKSKAEWKGRGIEVSDRAWAVL